MGTIDISLKSEDIAASRRQALRKLPLEVLVAITAPIVMALLPKDIARIPASSWLRYWQDYHYGIDGDEYWRAKYGDQVKTWWRRTLWCWRNANYWDHEHGVRPADIVRVAWEGDPKVSNRPYVPGELAIHAWDGAGNRYWCYVSVGPGWLPGRCERQVIGWKLKDVLDEFLADGILNNDPNQREILQAVYTWNPVMGKTDA